MNYKEQMADIVMLIILIAAGTLVLTGFICGGVVLVNITMRELNKPCAAGRQYDQ